MLWSVFCHYQVETDNDSDSIELLLVSLWGFIVYFGLEFDTSIKVSKQVTT